MPTRRCHFAALSCPPKATAGDQTMLTLIAQVGDVRVATTLMTFGAATPSTAPLDQAFTAAVQKVKAGK